MKFVGAEHEHHYLYSYPIGYNLINSKHSFLVSGQGAKKAIVYIYKKLVVSDFWVVYIVLNGEYVAITI